MVTLLFVFMKKEKGQTLTEYVMILLLIVIVCVVVLGLFGNRVVALYSTIVATF